MHGRVACMAGETATEMDGMHPTGMHSHFISHPLPAIYKTILELWWPGKKLSKVTSLLRNLFSYKHFISTIFLPVLQL